MDCHSARRILRQAEGPDEPSADLITAQQHWRHCGDCQEWERAEREWRAAIRQKLPPIGAPPELKERLFDTLAQARVGADLRRQRRRWSAAVIALAILGSSAAVLWLRREPARDGLLVDALTEDHLLYAARSAPSEFPSQEPEALASWFAGRVDFAVSVPAFPGATLLGGRLCTLVDRRVALSFYQRDGRRVSLFQMPAGGLPTGSLRRMTAGGKEFRCGHRKGVSVLAWTQRDVLFALVSDLPEADLVRLASG